MAHWAAGDMDNLRKFTPPWTFQKDDDQCFRVFDATGFFICSVTHREDLHSGAYRPWRWENHHHDFGLGRSARAGLLIYLKRSANRLPRSSDNCWIEPKLTQ